MKEYHYFRRVLTGCNCRHGVLPQFGKNRDENLWLNPIKQTHFRIRISERGSVSINSFVYSSCLALSLQEQKSSYESPFRWYLENWEPSFPAAGHRTCLWACSCCPVKFPPSRSLLFTVLLLSHRLTTSPVPHTWPLSSLRLT